MLTVSVGVAYKYALLRHEKWLEERRVKKRLQAHIRRYYTEHGKNQKGL